MIDFTHNIIVVDSEANHNDTISGGTERLGRQSIPNRPYKINNGDEVIVFDMKQMEKHVSNQNRILGREGTHFKGRRRTTQQH